MTYGDWCPVREVLSLCIISSNVRSPVLPASGRLIHRGEWLFEKFLDFECC
jgi:hypothetical protein